MDPILERYQALEDKVASYTPNLDTKRLYEAFTYADTEHHGQLRKSGEPYIIHPLAVADIVADLGLDQLSTYGLMSRLPAEQIRTLMDFLEAEGFDLERVLFNVNTPADYCLAEKISNSSLQ